jgi:hypothetical protein
MEVLQNLENLDLLLKTFWYVAIPVSIIFLIQTILTFVGAGNADVADADMDGGFEADAPFQLFSLRNLINFLLGFSWTGISFYTTIQNKALLVFLAVNIGILFVFLFFFIIRQVQKLAEDNSFAFTDTLHKTAEVYLTIPGHKEGKGKIMVSVKGAYHELEAMTEADTIPTGASVKIVKIENNHILFVEKL